MLLNCYGPTEATIWATSRVISPSEDEVAIGAPLPGYECHLFDQERRPVTAAGQVGELYIGGLGVARGYLNRAELTAAAFVPDPRGTGRRLYRTGDLARCRADGTLVYLTLALILTLPIPLTLTLTPTLALTPTLTLT